VKATGSPSFFASGWVVPPRPPFVPPFTPPLPFLFRREKVSIEPAQVDASSFFFFFPPLIPWARPDAGNAFTAEFPPLPFFSPPFSFLFFFFPSVVQWPVRNMLIALLPPFVFCVGFPLSPLLSLLFPPPFSWVTVRRQNVIRYANLSPAFLSSPLPLFSPFFFPQRERSLK